MPPRYTGGNYINPRNSNTINNNQVQPNYNITPNLIKKVILGVIGTIVGLIIIFGSFGTVPAGERGVKTRFKEVVSEVGEGLYFKLPIVEKVNLMNVQTKTVRYEPDNGEPLWSASKDLQDVQIAVVLNYRVDASQVQTIFRQYGTMDKYEEWIVRPAVRDTVKAVASQFTAEELVTKRPEFTDKITVVLNERMADKYVLIERINVTNFQFSKAFTEAIEKKVTAVQNAEASKNQLEQVKYEAQQTIETAKAQAEAIKIQAQAVNSQGGADYVQLQAIKAWDGHLPQNMIPGGAVPFLNLTK